MRNSSATQTHKPGGRGALWITRAGALLLGTLLALALLEGALQVAHLLRDERAPGALGSGSTAVLCLGDSHTYGVYYDARLSYPARLQAHLDASLGAGHVRVIRAGRPGIGTATMRRALPELLATHDPDWVLILGGLNNRWNRTDTGEHEGGSGSGLLGRSRLLRALRIYLGQRQRSAPDLAGEAETLPTFDHAVHNLDDAQLVADVRGDLRVLIQQCRDHGARPVLLTYAAPDAPLEAPNQALRAAAAEAEVPCIDLAASFTELLRQRPYDELLIPGDYHPRPPGYEYIAQQVATWLLQHSGAAQDLTPAEAETPPPAVNIRLDPARRGRLLITGPAGQPFRVLLSRGTEPPLRLHRAVVPLAANDALFRATSERADLTGTLDASGNGHVDLDLDAVPAEERAELSLFAVAVLLREVPTAGRSRPGVLAASAALPIPP